MMRKQRKWWAIGVIFFLSVMGGRLFIAECCIVPSPSMTPTIQPNEFIVYDKTTYGGLYPRRWSDVPVLNIFTWIPFLRNSDECRDWGYHRFPGMRKPQKNDVVVFHSPENESLLLVKRIYHIIRKGTPLKINSPQRRIILKIAEREGKQTLYRHGQLYIGGKRGTHYLPKQNFYYVLGDNRKNSHDSRSFGYIPESSIVGRMGLVLFSWDSEGSGIFKIRWHRLFHFIR